MFGLMAVVTGAVLASQANAGSIFFNEFHYDDVGTDGNEFIEVAVPDGTDVSLMSVVLYNGANGLSYDTDALTAFVMTDIAGPFTLYSFTYPVDGIQNGAPDGFALVDNGTTLQFLSYEGTFTALNGPANGILSTAISLGELNTTAENSSLGLTGTGNQYGDFTWAASSGANSKNAANAGQTFTAVPVPLPAAAWAGLALLGGTGLTKLRRRATAD
jgi:hypothetical protein